jgi:23S rRNA (guanosine2251-2'-O)-methyltransferase
MTRSKRFHHNKSAGKGPLRAAPRALSNQCVLYGWHPVVEALRNPRRVHIKLLATENAARRLEEEGVALSIAPLLVTPREIDKLLTPDAVHQGLYLECAPLESPSIEDLPQDALVLVFDQITDPHNVGAILRTAAAFGVNAILTTVRHSPEATGVLAKSASGGLEHVPIITVHNLSDALADLGREAYLRIGLDSDAPYNLSELKAIGTITTSGTITRPLALVLGAEGKGLRERTKANCDYMARLDMKGAIKSLNVSNAAAIALYAVTQP